MNFRHVWKLSTASSTPDFLVSTLNTARTFDDVIDDDDRAGAVVRLHQLVPLLLQGDGQAGLQGQKRRSKRMLEATHYSLTSPGNVARTLQQLFTMHCMPRPFVLGSCTTTSSSDSGRRLAPPNDNHSSALNAERPTNKRAGTAGSPAQSCRRRPCWCTA